MIATPYPQVRTDGGQDRQVVEFGMENRVSICWAGCSAPGTGRLGLCERHEKDVLGDKAEDSDAL